MMSILSYLFLLNVQYQFRGAWRMNGICTAAFVNATDFGRTSIESQPCENRVGIRGGSGTANTADACWRHKIERLIAS